MFFEFAILGDRLPPGVLCLTFDDGPGRTNSADGPGPRTAELGEYLRSLGVPATFFAVGEFAAQEPDILEGLTRGGHLVANHTRDHPSLPAFVARGGDVVGQLAETDEAIRDHVEGPVSFFRPPYGDWRLKGQARSNVAEKLNLSPLAGRFVGPIGWDIDAGDVGFWRDDRSAADCARAYLEAVERIGRGIVLMHDNTADIPEIRVRNRAVELAHILIPELLKRGLRFVRLDEVPQVASAARVDSLLTLTASDGRLLVAPPPGDDVALTPASSTIPPEAIFGRVDQGSGRWALRAANGCFLSSQGDALRATAPFAGENETFAVKNRGDGAIILRTADGRHLGPPADGGERLRVLAPSRADREIFRARDPHTSENIYN